MTDDEDDAPRSWKRTTLRGVERVDAEDTTPHSASQQSGARPVTREEMHEMIERALARAVRHGLQGRKSRSDLARYPDGEIDRLREQSKLSNAHITRTDLEARRAKIGLYTATAALLLALAGWLGREITSGRPPPAIIDKRDEQIERLQRDLDLLRAPKPR